MGGLALLAKQKGMHVSGVDGKIYPPMSEQLAAADIAVASEYDDGLFEPKPDVVVVGNANMPRGNPALEYVLDHNLNYTSGAEWLGNEILRDRHVIAISGTHGKTSTSSMVAWILESAGLDPGFLIGGVPRNFGVSSRLGSGKYFVVEADEYDTSYFDRRAKFLHYRPRILVINNIEFDHADVYEDLAEIQFQFQHLIRAVPQSGLIVIPVADTAVDEVLHRGCWTPTSRVQLVTQSSNRLLDSDGDLWTATDVAVNNSSFTVSCNGQEYGVLKWSAMGDFNVVNALAAIAAAQHAGVDPVDSMTALTEFQGVHRRLELFARRDQLSVYDDFAHHPTAIRLTLKALRDHVGPEHITAVIEPRTHTMSLGTLREELRTCCVFANDVIWFRGENILWDVASVAHESPTPAVVESDIERVIDEICTPSSHPRHVVLMSNGAFGGIYEKIRSRLSDDIDST